MLTRKEQYGTGKSKLRSTEPPRTMDWGYLGKNRAMKNSKRRKLIHVKKRHRSVINEKFIPQPVWMRGNSRIEKLVP